MTSLLSGFIYKAATLEETTLADFDELFAVKVRAPFLLVQQLVPIRGSGSSIVLLSSLAAHAALVASRPTPPRKAQSTHW
jgi:NAD(P)-dependent dehydrogenase (short-subunit alcohol dehydrogenase family)